MRKFTRKHQERDESGQWLRSLIRHITRVSPRHPHIDIFHNIIWELANKYILLGITLLENVTTFSKQPAWSLLFVNVFCNCSIPRRSAALVVCCSPTSLPFRHRLCSRSGQWAGEWSRSGSRLMNIAQLSASSVAYLVTWPQRGNVDRRLKPALSTSPGCPSICHENNNIKCTFCLFVDWLFGQFCGNRVS